MTTQILLPVGIYTLSVYTEHTEYRNDEKFSCSFATKHFELLQVSQLKIRYFPTLTLFFMCFVRTCK